MKKLISLLTVTGLLLTTGAGCAKTENKGLTLYDRTGQSLCVAESAEELKKDDRWAFLEIAVAEAAQALADRQKIGKTEAQKQLFADGYKITTTFDPMAFAALQTAMKTAPEDISLGCALTNLQGDLLAVYSTEESNHASQAYAPYEALMPLSVYAPAMDKELLHWSTVYEGSVTAYEGLVTGASAVAEQGLQALGASASVDFLKTAFGLPMQAETVALRENREGEILPQLARGDVAGMTAVQLAGCYQIFASGGQYTAPSAVKLVTDQVGTVVYVRQQQAQQVVTPETADVLNRMLQGAVQPKGIAPKAKCAEAETAGMAGKGEAGSWFVGVTPGYSCALWHSQSESYRADELFGAVVGQLYGEGTGLSRSFITHKNLHQIAYCTVSGQSFSAGCSQIETGYYKQSDALQICSACVK